MTDFYWSLNPKVIKKSGKPKENFRVFNMYYAMRLFKY